MIMLINQMRTDAKRCLTSYRIWLCAAVSALLLYAVSFNVIYAMPDVISQLLISINGPSTFLIIICILPIFPFALTFAIEWEEHATSFWIIRTGIKPYVLSKVIVSTLSGFMVTGLGIMFFVCIARLNLPLYTQITSGDPYVPLLENGRPLIYLLAYTTHYALSGALAAASALWFSTIFPNRYMTVAAPTMLYFVFNRITAFMDIPGYLKATYWIEGMYPAGSPEFSLLVKIATVTLICFLMGCGAIKNIERRVLRD